MKKVKTSPEPCPCGGASYAGCCQPYHLGLPAPDAEKLMRSRYSAYVFGLEDYLLATWHPDTRPASLQLARDNTKWLGLEVKRYLQHDPDTASVEFVARCKSGGRAQRLHEVSRFRRQDGRWYYVEGEFRA